MNTNNIPGYTAEASLYSSGQFYQAIRASGALPVSRGVLPQLPIGFCQAECSPGDYQCLFDCMGGRDGGGDGGGGGGGEHCSPACGPCYPDPDSPMGGFRTCVDYNCNTHDRQCIARFPRGGISNVRRLW
jgi:hypothetical protein